jgi:putative ABC transport system permease protein
MTFTSLAVFIACLGLFGLIAFTAEQRTKEIGIRKVLGASVSNITYMLSKELITLVIVSNVIAWPIAWYVMSQWLQSFAYRIQIEWYIFVSAGLLAVIIALATVTTQSVKAALLNPVDSLKGE